MNNEGDYRIMVITQFGMREKIECKNCNVVMAIADEKGLHTEKFTLPLHNLMVMCKCGTSLIWRPLKNRNKTSSQVTEKAAQESWAA
jgi:hypothetical protein